MAKTTRDKPKKQQNKPDTGPVLVEEPPDEPQVVADPVIEEVEDVPADESTPADDPRRVPPQQTFKVEEEEIFWNWLGQVPDPQNMDLYGYRLFPVIKVMPPIDWNGEPEDAPTHIFKIKGLITPETNRIANREWLRNTWGSGEYHLRVLDRRLKRSQNRQICKAKVDVNDWDTHLPVFNDWSELVPVERNKWIINRLCKDKIIKRNPEGGFMPYQDGSAAAPTSGTSPDVALLDKVLGFAERQFQRSQPTKDKDQESAGVKAMDIMASTVKDVIKEATKPAAAPDNSIALLLTEMLKNQRAETEVQRKEAEAARQREVEEAREARHREADEAKAARDRENAMFKEMLAEARKQPDTLAQFSKFGEVFKTLKEEIGGTDSAESKQSRMNGWQEFFSQPLTELMSGIKPLLAAGAQILIMKNAQAQHQRPGQPQHQTQPQQAGPPQRFTSPAAEVAAPNTPATQQQAPPMQPPEPPQAPPATAPQPEGMPPMPPPMNLESQYQQQLISRVLDAYLDKLRDRLSDPDETGELLAAFMCDDTISLGNLPPFRLKGYEAFTGLKKAGADVGMTPREFILMQFRETRDQAGRQFLWEEFAGTPAKEKRFIEYIDEFLEYDPDKP